VQEEMEQRLCDALSQMDGVGAVHVVVTLESTGKKIVEKDVPTRSTTEENKKGEETGSVTSSSQDEATVYEKTQNGAETPYVVSGVLVIAEGGGNPVTIQEIQEAVMALFQVGANKIKVVKMK
jgi:stage III sporulation protein AG